MSSAAKPWLRRWRVRAATSRLVLQKIMAFSTPRVRSSRTSVWRFFAASVGTKTSSTDSALRAGGVTATSTGSCTKVSTSRRTSGGMVAENSRVWRRRTSRRMILSTSGMKPMSSMRSASSITRISTPLSRILPRSNQSSRRPGVAITTSTSPRSRIFSCSPMPTPPMSSTMCSGRYLANSSKLRAVWVASSRVGERISARGMRARLRPPASFCSTGSRKAAVLPVPVWAMPTRLRPASTSGMARAWMGVGCV
ncbi:hypothetical protein HRbin39_01829 [bacterium HR39]|nr:hypothetical protein HRbin39_01829 [bacterium HR39]